MLGNDSSDAERQQIEEFVQILTREQRRIFYYIFSLLPNRADAEEVLQNTNLVLWRKADSYRHGTSFYRWACGVAHLEVLKWRERRSRDSITFSASFIEEIGSDLVRHEEVIEQRRLALSDCLRKLSDRDRTLILLRYEEGATTQSVADQLARPIKSVYAALSRIRDQLLECINRTIARDHKDRSLALGDNT